MARYNISSYPWGGEYQPRAEAVLTLTKDALRVKLTAWEQRIIGSVSDMGGPVYKDSCLEFFFQPCPDTDARYLNVECNVLGVLLIGLGDSRKDRLPIHDLPKGLRPMVQIVAGQKWSVRYDLPLVWLQTMFPSFHPKLGDVIRGNFLKCDESIHPHFGCWNPITAPEPDFHRPEFFGEIVLL